MNKIQQMPEVGTNGNNMFLMATLDGCVTMRTPGGDMKLTPEQAYELGRQMYECAKVAKHVNAVADLAPRGLTEPELIEWLTKALGGAN